jgi:nucleoid DNA-binding protein
MQKTELINSVAKSTGVDRATVRLVANGIFETIKSQLWIGVNIKIKDFMSFTLETRPETIRRNPQTDEKMVIPKQYRVKASMSQVFKDKIKTKIVYDG